MRHLRHHVRLFLTNNLSLVIVLLAMATGPLWAEGRKPPQVKPKTEQKSTLKEAKDDANTALNNLDKGIHEAAGEAKEGANRALQAVDDTVHGRNHKEAK